MNQLAEEMGLTQEEVDLVDNRKSPDLPPRQFLRVTELQNRAALYRSMAAGPERDALVSESIAMRDEIAALDFETTGMATLGDLNRRLVEFSQKVLVAAKANPR